MQTLGKKFFRKCTNAFDGQDIKLMWPMLLSRKIGLVFMVMNLLYCRVAIIIMPQDILLQVEIEKNNKFCGLGRVFGLFMAFLDGLMGYGYEIRLHNGKSSGAWADSGPAQTTVVQTVRRAPLRVGTSRSGV